MAHNDDLDTKMIAKSVRITVQFLTWWLDELKACVPGRVRALVWPEPKQLRIEMRDDVLRVSVAGRRKPMQDSAVSRIPGDIAGTAAGLKSLLKSERLSIQAAAIELGRDQVLNPEFDVPVESAQNLDEVVRAEIDRRTPFSPDEVYYTYRVAGADTEMKRLTVRLWIAKADFIDEAAQIALAAGLSPVRIGVDGDRAAANSQAPIDLLPPSLAAGHAPYFSRLAWGLVLAILAMGAATIHLSFENRHAILIAAEAKAKTLRQDRQAEEKARKQLDDLMTVANAIFEKRQSKMASIILLDELTKRLPDSSWLQQLAVNGEKASISGYSRNSSSLVRSLGKGKFFKDIRFAAPVTRDQRLGQDRFNLTFAIGRKAGQ